MPNKSRTDFVSQPSPEYPLKDLEIHAANAMYAVGGAWENTAVQLVMTVVEPERTHFEGLLLYARIAYDRGLMEDAVRVLLRLIMQKQEHEDVKRYLADCFEVEIIHLSHHPLKTVDDDHRKKEQWTLW